VKKILLLVFFLFSCEKEPPIQRLVIDVNPVDGGTVSQTYGEFQFNESVVISAEPNQEFHFIGWSGDINSQINPLEITFDSNKNLVANFIKKTYNFELNIVGSGSVSQSVVQQGGSRPYSSGSIIELNAIPQKDWIFTNWGGDIDEPTNPIKITIDSDKKINAVFSKKTNNKNSSTFLALGDSYTIGNGVNYDQRWPVKLINELNKTTEKINKIEFIAMSGATSSQLLTAINNAKLDPSFGLISILIGVNNQFQGKSQIEFKEDFIKILQKSISLVNGNKSRIFVLSIPDWGSTPFGKAYDRSKVSNEINQFNSIVKAQAELNGIKYINITDISRQALFDLSLVSSDNLHPSSKMYGLWVDRIIDHVSKIEF
jgi:acyl-CoA thioesterase-1